MLSRRERSRRHCQTSRIPSQVRHRFHRSAARRRQIRHHHRFRPSAIPLRRPVALRRRRFRQAARPVLLQRLRQLQVLLNAARPQWAVDWVAVLARSVGLPQVVQARPSRIA